MTTICYFLILIIKILKNRLYCDCLLSKFVCACFYRLQKTIDNDIIILKQNDSINIFHFLLIRFCCYFENMQKKISSLLSPGIFFRFSLTTTIIIIRKYFIGFIQWKFCVYFDEYHYRMNDVFGKFFSFQNLKNFLNFLFLFFWNFKILELWNLNDAFLVKFFDQKTK